LSCVAERRQADSPARLLPTISSALPELHYCAKQ